MRCRLIRTLLLPAQIHTVAASRGTDPAHGTPVFGRSDVPEMEHHRQPRRRRPNVRRIDDRKRPTRRKREALRRQVLPAPAREASPFHVTPTPLAAPAPALARGSGMPLDLTPPTTRTTISTTSSHFLLPFLLRRPASIDSSRCPCSEIPTTLPASDYATDLHRRHFPRDRLRRLPGACRAQGMRRQDPDRGHASCFVPGAF